MCMKLVMSCATSVAFCLGLFLHVHAHGIFGIAMAWGMMMFAGLIGMLMQTLWVGRDMLEANVSYQDRR